MEIDFKTQSVDRFWRRKTVKTVKSFSEKQLKNRSVIIVWFIHLWFIVIYYHLSFLLQKFVQILVLF